MTKAARAQQEADEELFAGLDEDQREQLRQLLIALCESIAAGDRGGQVPAAGC